MSSGEERDGEPGLVDPVHRAHHVHDPDRHRREPAVGMQLDDPRVGGQRPLAPVTSVTLDHPVELAPGVEPSDALTAERLGALAPLCALGIHNFPMPRTIGTGDLTTPIKVRRLAIALDVEVLHGHGAKGGVNAITASLAFEYSGQGIRVCGIAPGGTETMSAGPRSTCSSSPGPL